ncbi:MAG TPA: hypothetical protein VM076_02240 [Gemmatimonadaceae bacterium]|nr:hypothetical protein [Gemmatimonadaceae bacterium]
MRAEQRFWGGNLGALESPLHCPTTGRIIGHSFFEEYSFSAMAYDEALVGTRQAPAIMGAAWEVARSAGMWWPFEHAAIMTDRPSEIRLNAEHLLERGDGPAVVYRDGRRVYAWNGKAVPEKWILEPEKVPPRDLKGFDPTFRKFVDAKVGKPGAKAKQPKRVSILETVLPTDANARLEVLRAHAGGKLPLLERYRTGEHDAVWTELVALGVDVRSDERTADAFAVAYETMARVEANVRMLVQRLAGIGYRFVAKHAHVPPKASVAKEIVAFERQHGPLPVALRAFYEVVGEVNLMGRHPAIDPPGNRTAPDPLVVYGFDDGLVELDDDGERPSAITIGPDDLHKANTSGGDPYEIAIPNPGADGELLNERHGLLFVDYLRLAFRFGGFPGYDGVDDAPPSLNELTRGLQVF